MKLPRRTFLHLAAGAAALPGVSRIAWAQAYPTRPVTLIVFVPAGSAPDITARLIGQSLSQRLGQSVVVDNRPGAGGNLALQAVARAQADGYTLLLVSTAHAINATLYEKSNVSVARDIAPVASISDNPFVMVVSPSLPAKTLAEFIAYAKANPGKINMTSSGSGNLSHLSGELFKMMVGIDMMHVPYRGSVLAHTGLMAGEVHVMFDALLSALPQIQAGKLRALAVTTATRWKGLPDIPTVGEFVPGYTVSGLLGFGAPKGTPAEIVGGLNREINAVIADASITARLAELGSTPLPGSPADYGKLIAEDTEKWGKVIRAANIKPEQGSSSSAPGTRRRGDRVM
jgi:tripartite-type tricarboxylate transporter receptor subunit TctC